MDQSALRIAAFVDHIVTLRYEAIKLKERGENRMREKGRKGRGVNSLAEVQD